MQLDYNLNLPMNFMNQINSNIPASSTWFIRLYSSVIDICLTPAMSFFFILAAA